MILWPAIGSLRPVPVSWRGQDVLRSGFRVDVPSDIQFDVLMRGSAGAIEGRVTQAPAESAAGGVVAVLPVDEAEAYRFRSARIGVDGTFRIEGLAPGEYRIYAWAELDGDAWRNPVFMESYREQGQVVRVSAGGESLVSIDVLP